MNDELKTAQEELKKAEDLANATALQVENATSQVSQAMSNGVALGWDKSAVLTLSIAILVFGLIVLGLIVYLTVKQASSPFILQAFALPLIIISAIFLVVTGYSQEQISPVIGLLGTIAGYLLGSTTVERRTVASSPPVQTATGAGPSTASPSAAPIVT